MANIDIFLHALRLQESGDNYRARNASSGASGAYQFLWGTWLYALQLAGLRHRPYNYESANNAPASVQDAAAKALVSHYYGMFGNSYYNVAEAWYGGPGAVGHPNWGGGPGYPNVGQYASQVMAKYRSLGGGSRSAQQIIAQAQYQYDNPAIIKDFEYANSLHNHAIPSNIAWIQFSQRLVS